MAATYRILLQLEKKILIIQKHSLIGSAEGFMPVTFLYFTIAMRQVLIECKTYLNLKEITAHSTFNKC